MSATAMAILHWNAIPVFVDINEENFCINPKLIESKITQRTRAILSVDIFGNSADMNEIMRIAKKHNLTVISDSAQSPGAKHKGRNAGTISHIGGISLNYHKHIHTGEGGVLFTENDELANRMRLIRNHAESVVEGMGQSDLTNMVGFNFRLGEIEAAIGIQQLKKLEEIIAKKQSIANKLTEELSPLQGIKLPKIQNQLEHVYYVYPIILEPTNLGVSRERIFNALKSEGLINISEGYVNVHLLPIFQKKIAFGKNGFPWVTTSENSNVSYQKGICPVAERLHDETYLSIGLGGLDLSEKDVKKIGATFRKVWANLDQLK
jgi:dTDP-4-amino-4,6-dideoxygalactose transaminase